MDAAESALGLDFSIDRLGKPEIPSPMRDVRFVSADERVLYDVSPQLVRRYLESGQQPPSLERAGPRERIFFDPATASAGIVTCGGLCPGLNDVIRATVMSLYYHYGIRRILGFRYGYEGLTYKHGHEPIALTPGMVGAIDDTGGTLLGTSRGDQDVGEMVDFLTNRGVNILFAVGGDGTLRGAGAIAAEVRRRALPIAVIGIPKTIDNDISFIDESFGFQTAVSEARRVTYGAHCEAEAARNGIGLVKLMGRESGFISAYVTLADSQVNFCLVPEVPFTIEVFLERLRERLDARQHAVIVVSEGAGQDQFAGPITRDASGNLHLVDIGIALRDSIKAYFRDLGMDISLKYLDPSYAIRSQPANAYDSAFCVLLAHNAVHAAMAGRTNMVAGKWHGEYTHVPISLATSSRKKIDPEGWLWTAVIHTTGQPDCV